MTAKTRIKKLEDAARKQNGGDDTVIIVYYAKDGEPPDENQVITVNGEGMILGEAQRRWPDSDRHIFHVRPRNED